MAVTLPPQWPAGFSAAGVACGIKGAGAADLGVLVADRPVSWAGTFTRNAAAAAPVVWSRSRRGEPVRAVVVNSGNANACTGAAGRDAVVATANAAASELGCDPAEVLVASTGPIGVPLPVDLVVAGVPRALASLAPPVDTFARSIMTTDTHPKIAVADAGGARLVGVAKGAAMLAPNMATMLAFVATDAAVTGDALDEMVTEAVDRSFNRISIDACESTNDSVFVLAGGSIEVEASVFTRALEGVCRRLAEMIVRDAEGGTKFVRIGIVGAVDERSARELGLAVAASALWRAAVHGGDPNWGRVLSALGASHRDLDLGAIEVSIGDEPVFRSGAPAGTRERAAANMAADEIIVTCRVGIGPGEAEILSADLSPQYVLENAFGTS